MVARRFVAIYAVFLLMLSASCYALAQSYKNEEEYKDAIKSKLASLSFYCKEKLEAVPNASLLNEKFPEISNLTSDTVINPNLKGQYFPLLLKKTLIQRAKVRYECATERSQALSELGPSLGILYDLIQHDLLANSLLLIAQNSDAYTFLSSQQQLGKTRLGAWSQLLQQLKNERAEFKPNLHKETIFVEDHLNQVIEQLDALTNKLRTNRNFTCEVVGSYRVCFN